MRTDGSIIYEGWCRYVNIRNVAMIKNWLLAHVSSIHEELTGVGIKQSGFPIACAPVIVLR
jgi:hypothetical protein